MRTASPSHIPKHVAIIMDGNGRWAQAKGLSRIRGHQVGADSVIACLTACRETGIKYLTLYAFSVENWIRPRQEISGLMSLLRRFVKSREQELHKHRIRLRVIGRSEDLPADIRRQLNRVQRETAQYDDRHLILALSYGGRTEIAQAAQALARETVRGDIRPEDITEKSVAAHLYAPDVPDPDLLIRTSGEMRLSNFLLWQAAYTEMVFTDVLWPDFREAQFRQALDVYSRRKRRFGGVS